jgi:hypothetical protein
MLIATANDARPERDSLPVIFAQRARKVTCAAHARTNVYEMNPTGRGTEELETPRWM